MRIDVYVPLVLALLLTSIAPGVGRRVSPGLAARVLVTAATLTAAASTWALLLLGATLIDQAPAVIAEAGEEGRVLPEPVPETVAVLAVAALAVIAHRLLHVLRARIATRRLLLRLCEGHPPDSELVVAASPAPHAFAIPGRPGRILVTAAMLGALEPAERRVLLAHERAHLTHRHAALSTAVSLAAAANPLLVPVRETVAFLLERWADEEAASAVGDRRTTARALARAALASRRARPGCALHFSEHAVTRRIAALQTAPPPVMRSVGAAVLALGALPALGAADATSDLLHLLAGTLPGL
ncbi:peptidase M48 [Streptomyces populi]|uniref:Peptidase M48 n=1 Tax=Streptomyces populi TaxID=2058924 RepID=A0A2I0SER0_9ACTN|nr:M56 family metallopeptidase [Streptomyces populi]PKT68421.1 peptidase M48 [Streptomyces populi]